MLAADARGASAGFAARPSSTAIRINAPDAGPSIVTNGFAGTSLRSSYIADELADVVPAEPERGLREVVRAEREEVGASPRSRRP